MQQNSYSSKNNSPTARFYLHIFNQIAYIENVSITKTRKQIDKNWMKCKENQTEFCYILRVWMFKCEMNTDNGSYLATGN